MTFLPMCKILKIYCQKTSPICFEVGLSGDISFHDFSPDRSFESQNENVRRKKQQDNNTNKLRLRKLKISKLRFITYSLKLSSQ